MRRFSPGYLRDTRRGFWEDRTALEALALDDRERILDVGCGTGELTRVLRDESPATVVGIDADRALLDHADADALLQGDAFHLPFQDDAFDLVVCQALLINLPNPASVVEEFARVSRDLVGAIEPDNSRVSVDSTVDSEAPLADRARRAFIRGVDTDVTLGPAVPDLFREVGIEGVDITEHTLHRRTAPPYSAAGFESARKKAAASRIDDLRTTLRAGGLSAEAVDALRDEWQAMGRSVVEQMAREEYERTARIPFFVTVGRVPTDGEGRARLTKR